MNIKEKIKNILILYFCIGLIFGSIETINNRVVNETSGCEYKSYAGYVLIGRIAICELARARFIKPQNITMPIRK